MKWNGSEKSMKWKNDYIFLKKNKKQKKQKKMRRGQILEEMQDA